MFPLPPGFYRSDVEPNSLSERQLRAPVDGVRLAPHVRLPGVRPRFPAAARVLRAAERTTDLGARGAYIAVPATAIAALRGQEALYHLRPRGENSRRHPIGHAHLQCHRL